MTIEKRIVVWEKENVVQIWLYDQSGDLMDIQEPTENDLRMVKTRHADVWYT
jgi:hypothetical protein